MYVYPTKKLPGSGVQRWYYSVASFVPWTNVKFLGEPLMTEPTRFPVDGFSTRWIPRSGSCGPLVSWHKVAGTTLRSNMVCCNVLQSMAVCCSVL